MREKGRDRKGRMGTQTREERNNGNKRHQITRVNAMRYSVNHI
jgi:hypothetical protein